MKNIIQLHNCNKITSYYALIVTAVLNRILKKLSYMKQKAILLKSYVVFLALFLFLSSLSAFAATPVSDFTYEILEGQVTITGYTGSDEHVVIPSEIEGQPVTELGRRAFRENTQAKSFVLPDSLRRIGDQCFMLCENLETIEIPAQVEKIGNFAFAGCLRLSRVTLPASVAEIGAFVFNRCPELIEISVSEGNPNYSSRDGVLFDEEQTTLIKYPSNRAAVEYTI
ncbi:MAG: leucine-rich repeat domain-containing protein, partial [Bacteroidales bacterium]|nr:leucine-rich repeat domain-containing protein [Bacteroidales bacterium]